VPVDLRFGANDPVGGPAVGQQLATALPNATVNILPDAGHLPWLDDPAWLAAGIHCTVERTATI
jgi:pimeloyl-ACP methyl ester carboxylesterase